MMNDTISADRLKGILLGLAAGDKNGGPIQMALRLAQSLAERQRFDLEDIWNGYRAWWRKEGFDTGPTADSVFAYVEAGMSREEAVQQVDMERDGQTTGCNPAHRATPLAMASFLPDDVLPDLALQEARLTHAHPLAGDVSAACVVLCRKLSSGKPWLKALHETAVGRMPETQDALLQTSQHPLDDGGYAPEVLRAAVFFVAINEDFDAALSASLEFAGPVNYCPVLVGALAGARWGAKAIPASQWTDGLTVGRIERVISSFV